jgi:hypothetical protein
MQANKITTDDRFPNDQQTAILNGQRDGPDLSFETLTSLQ